MDTAEWHHPTFPTTGYAVAIKICTATNEVRFVNRRVVAGGTRGDGVGKHEESLSATRMPQLHHTAPFIGVETPVVSKANYNVPVLDQVIWRDASNSCSTIAKSCIGKRKRGTSIYTHFFPFGIGSTSSRTTRVNYEIVILLWKQGNLVNSANLVLLGDVTIDL